MVVNPMGHTCNPMGHTCNLMGQTCKQENAHIEAPPPVRCSHQARVDCLRTHADAHADKHVRSRARAAAPSPLAHAGCTQQSRNPC
eukprot:3738284-Pleurochrysis_carterae.AAC.2